MESDWKEAYSLPQEWQWTCTLPTWLAPWLLRHACSDTQQLEEMPVSQFAQSVNDKETFYAPVEGTISDLSTSFTISFTW